MNRFVDFFLMKDRETPSPGFAYLCMGLSALVYLPASAYDERLRAALGVTNVVRFGGASAYDVHMLAVSEGPFCILAVEGTRNFPQWFSNFGDSQLVDAPVGPGRVTQSFLLRYNFAIGPAMDNTPRVANFCVTGHSLGAIVGALLARSMSGFGQDIESSYLFGCPRAVTQGWIDANPVPTYLFNHPHDPIPMISTTPRRGVFDDNLLGGWSGQVRDPAQPRWLPGWSAQNSGRDQLDNLCALAASTVRFGTSAHQPYQYLRALRDELTRADLTLLKDFTTLMTDLGWFNPGD